MKKGQLRCVTVLDNAGERNAESGGDQEDRAGLTKLCQANEDGVAKEEKGGSIQHLLRWTKITQASIEPDQAEDNKTRQAERDHFFCLRRYGDFQQQYQNG